ncbi:2OG-Fe dioxygenase family protein [Vibrio sp.]|nr:2OG-Fe dioxygenase family protein [Vibrio sp.]
MLQAKLHDNTLHMTHLSYECVDSLIPSFDRLPHTNHADGQFRLRRYSVIKIINGYPIPLEQHDFVQSETINHFQGDIVRRFEPIEEKVLHSDALKEILDVFMETNHLHNGQVIEIHQMRIDAVHNETQVSPEGVHQDGFDHIALIGIHRENVVGGDALLYFRNKEAPFMRAVLDDGDMLMLDDRQLWHNAAPICAVNKEKEGHMDVLVLTARHQ